MTSPLSPGTVRKVTEEDKELAETELMPYFGKEELEFEQMKWKFASDRKLTLRQVDLIILELRRRKARG